jgi:hypothetical protein
VAASNIEEDADTLKGASSWTIGGTVVWSVNPYAKTVTVFQDGSSVHTYAETETVPPEYPVIHAVPVKDFFEGLE